MIARRHARQPVAAIAALVLSLTACTEPGSVEGHVVAGSARTGVDGAQVLLVRESRATDSVISPVCEHLAKLTDVAARAPDSAAETAYASSAVATDASPARHPVDDSLGREVQHFSNAAASLQSTATYTDERGYFEFRRVTPGRFLVVAFYSSGPGQMTWVSHIVTRPRAHSLVTLDGGSHLALGAWCRQRTSRTTN